jgi:hypothetical protein
MAITISGDSPNFTSATLTTPTLTSPTFAGTPSGSIITSGTAVASTSGTSIDFTSIPSWVKRITVLFNGVSTNGTSAPQIQIGDSGGVETTGYLAGGGIGQQSNNWVLTAFTSGFPVAAANGAWGATALFHGSMTITNLTGNVWVANAVFYNSTATVQIYLTAGSKTLSSTLDRVRITTDNGTDTFDAGTINILYE